MEDVSNARSDRTAEMPSEAARLRLLLQGAVRRIEATVCLRRHL